MEMEYQKTIHGLSPLRIIIHRYIHLHFNCPARGRHIYAYQAPYK